MHKLIMRAKACEGARGRARGGDMRTTWSSLGTYGNSHIKMTGMIVVPSGMGEGGGDVQIGTT